MTNSNGRNIAIVTGSALGLGYELTKQLIADGWFVWPASTPRSTATAATTCRRRSSTPSWIRANWPE